MKRFPVYLLIICLITPVVIIWTLWLYSNNINDRENDFERIFIPDGLVEINSRTLDFTPQSIIRTTNQSICLQDDIPGRLTWLDYALKPFRSAVFKDSGQQGKIAYMHLDSPDLFIFHLNSSMAMILNLNTGATSKYSLGESFYKGVVISKGSFIIRGVDSTCKDRVFRKITVGDSLVIQEEKGITPKRNDGGFSTDGMLYFDRESHILCYTYFYRNGFVCLDTNLKSVCYGKTIDTTRSPQVVGIPVISEGKNLSFTLLSPPRFINLKGCVSGGKLFLRSALKGDNENPYAFESNSVLDVYRLQDGAYRGSFYLPTYKGNRANAFQVDQDKLVALYGSRIVLYKLNKKIV